MATGVPGDRGRTVTTPHRGPFFVLTISTVVLSLAAALTIWRRSLSAGGQRRAAGRVPRHGRARRGKTPDPT